MEIILVAGHHAGGLHARLPIVAAELDLPQALHPGCGRLTFDDGIDIGDHAVVDHAVREPVSAVIDAVHHLQAAFGNIIRERAGGIFGSQTFEL